jgi:alpha-beta hydrolase superfamily lysophospholipase
VRRHEGRIGTSGGLTLLSRAWLPDAPARGAVAIIHGYAEHSARYEHVGASIARAGYAAHAFDLRGHGASEGPRALVRSFNEYVDDVDGFLADVREVTPDAPLFLLGHSMGGAILALYVLVRHSGARGLIFSGAALRSGRPMAASLAPLVQLLGPLVPSLPLIRLDAAQVSRDPGVVERYVTDPLVYHGRMKAGLLAAAVRAGRFTSRHMDRIATPLLVLHGGADGLADPDGSRKLMERASAADKTLRIYDGLFHEILNEPEQGQVLEEIVGWLDARTTTSAGTRRPEAAG